MIDQVKKCFEYEAYHEGENKILKVYLEKCSFPPSIEYSGVCMAKVVQALLENSGVNIIVLTQLREYEYDYSQTEILNELALLFKKINKEDRYAYSKIVADPLHERYIRSSYAQFRGLVSKRLSEDPLAAYVELKRMERKEKVKLTKVVDPRHHHSQQLFVNILEEIIPMIEKTKIIYNG